VNTNKVKERDARIARLILQAEADTKEGRTSAAAAGMREVERLTRERDEQLDDMPPPPKPRPLDGPVYGRSVFANVDGFGELDRYVRTGVNEQQAMVVGSDLSGGLAVRPTLVAAAFVDEQAQNALDLAGATPIAVEGDAYEEVIVEGDTIEYAPEIPDGSENTNPVVKLFRAEFRKVRDFQFVSEWQRQTQAVDITGAVIRNTIDQIKRAEDAALNGDGVGLRPRGMLPDASITRFDVEGTTGTTISNTVSDLGSAPKLVQLMGQLPSRFHRNAVWMCHGSTFAAIRALVDAEGRPYFPEAYTGNTLIGKPVILNDGIPVGGTADQPVIIFGDFSRGFRRVYRSTGLSLRLLSERYADRDLVAIRTIFYFAHGVIAPQAFVIGVADSVA
jgi:HK97 family phage major capsid protein